VLLVDKSLVGRGGATVMAQMTVAAALGEECPDDWTAHLEDTLASGRGLCDENLAALLCQGAPARIREMGEWRVGWARRADGHIAQVTAPGHSVPRCCYVDFLNTGPAVAATLRRRIGHVDAIRRVGNLTVTGPTASGFLTAYPTAAAPNNPPVASNVNFTAGQTVPSLSAVEIGLSGKISIFNSFGSTDVVLDLSGWYG
jgi:aspartate oxidase